MKDSRGGLEWFRKSPCLHTGSAKSKIPIAEGRDCGGEFTLEHTLHTMHHKIRHPVHRSALLLRVCRKDDPLLHIRSDALEPVQVD